MAECTSKMTVKFVILHAVAYITRYRAGAVFAAAVNAKAVVFVFAIGIITADAVITVSKQRACVGVICIVKIFA